MTWVANNTGDLVAAIEYFHERLPGWWFSVGVCHVSADATVAPDSAGCDADLLRESTRYFDGGFDTALLPPATMADALRRATDIALLARDRYLVRNKVSDAIEALAAIGVSDCYDKGLDLAGSIKEGFAAIRERVAAGGPGWERET